MFFHSLKRTNESQTNHCIIHSQDQPKKKKKTKFNLKTAKFSFIKKKKKGSNKDTGIRALADFSSKKFVSRNIAITEVKLDLQKPKKKKKEKKSKEFYFKTKKEKERMKVKKRGEREEGPDAEQPGQFLHLRTPFLLYGLERGQVFTV